MLGTFVIINLFIAIVINNLDEAKAERLKELKTAPGLHELMQELQDAEATLNRLQERLRDAFDLDQSPAKMRKVPI